MWPRKVTTNRVTRVKFPAGALDFSVHRLVPKDFEECMGSYLTAAGSVLRCGYEKCLEFCVQVSGASSGEDKQTDNSVEKSPTNGDLTSVNSFNPEHI